MNEPGDLPLTYNHKTCGSRVGRCVGRGRGFGVPAGRRLGLGGFLTGVAGIRCGRFLCAGRHGQQENGAKKEAEDSFHGCQILSVFFLHHIIFFQNRNTHLAPPGY